MVEVGVVVTLALSRLNWLRLICLGGGGGVVGGEGGGVESGGGSLAVSPELAAAELPIAEDVKREQPAMWNNGGDLVYEVE